MNTIGVGTHGTSTTTLPADRLIVTPELVVSAEIRVPKLTAYLDGLAGGDQVARPVIYRDGVLVATGAETLVATNQAAGWTDFPMAQAGGYDLIADANYRFGLHTGPGDAIRIYGDADAGGRLYTDAYAGGAMSPLTGGAASNTPSIFATYFLGWEAPDVSDIELARLGFGSAQKALGGGKGVLEAYSAVCGWHGVPFDPEIGSFAIVQEDGSLAGLLGERVRVRYGDQSVVAYVHQSGDVVEDLTVTRRLFMELTVPATDEIEVEVEVLG